jgi:molybdenum cofactor cytidylyltransferase
LGNRRIVEAIILAAGLSTRMGSDKMALNVSGQTFLNRTLIETLNSKLNQIVVVSRPGFCLNLVQHNSDFLKRHVINVSNFWPQEGMSLSIRLGLTQLSAQANAVMIILADQVFLNALLIDMLIEESFQNSGKIIVPMINGRSTTPVIFPASFFSELRKISGDKGGREILAANLKMIHVLELGQKYDDTDVDTPEDYSKVISKFKENDRI